MCLKVRVKICYNKYVNGNLFYGHCTYVHMHVVPSAIKFQCPIVTADIYIYMEI